MDTSKQEHPAHCTFCELIHGSAEVSICHEDADAIAFMDIQPVNNGHVLVVPREHHESLLDVPEELGVHLFKVTMRLANAIRTVTGCDDLNIVVNSGAAAGQDEPHYHVHIIPRRAGDGFDIPLPFNGSEMPDRTVLDAYAARIISALRDPVRDGNDDTTGHGERATASDTPRDAVRKDPSETAAVAAPASGGRKTKAFRADRAVRLATFDETSPAHDDVSIRSTPSRERVWNAEEGAHGELKYEPRTSSGDEV